MLRYREDIPAEIRLVYHIFREMPFFGESVEAPYPSYSYLSRRFIYVEKNLEHWYNSMNSNALSAILGNGRLKKILEENLSTLTQKEERIIKLRHGLEDGKPHVLEYIGKECNRTRARIRQIEAAALRKLRDRSRSRKIMEYFEQQYKEYQKSLFTLEEIS